MTSNNNTKNIVKSKIKIISNNDVSKKIINKKHLLQFLPEKFFKFENIKNIEYNGKKIKTDYLIDLLSGLILKYYFKKENNFILNSSILKERYGHIYNYYINYLIDEKILFLKSNYIKGVRSRIYSINEEILKSKIKRYKNSDKFLLKKYKNKVFDSIEPNTSNLIDLDVKIKLISDLFDVKIDYDMALFLLNTQESDNIDILNRNIYAIDSINNKHIFYHFDKYGRMHTNYTILRSPIRKNCLLIDEEETIEIDISNSQPLFLSKLIYDKKTNWVKKDEFDLFKRLTINGEFYKYFMDILNIENKKDIKKMIYKVFFGKNYKKSKYDNLFAQIFPTIHNFIKLYKKEKGDYKILSHDLQSMESNLIFNKIIKKIKNEYPEIKIITVHDSIIVPKKYKEKVYFIFNNELLNEFNF